MATDDRPETTITLPDEAYDRLEARRREGENLEDVIDRLQNDGVDIYNGFGIFADVNIEEAVEAVKREMDEDFEEHIDEVSRQ